MNWAKKLLQKDDESFVFPSHDCPRGADAKAFSCCFVDRDGQDKIEGVEHVDSTFRVVYGDGTVTTDWIF